VPANAVLPDRNKPPRILRRDGTAFPTEIGPPRTLGYLTGAAAVAAIREELVANSQQGARRAHTLRLECSGACEDVCKAGGACHGDNLAALGRQMVAARDARAAAAQPVKKRATRRDKGQPKGPRALKGGQQYRIGLLSLYRYRYGIERQVSQATRDAVAEGLAMGVKPWLSRQAQADMPGQSDDRPGARAEQSQTVVDMDRAQECADDTEGADASQGWSPESAREADEAGWETWDREFDLGAQTGRRDREQRQQEEVRPTRQHRSQQKQKGRRLGKALGHTVDPLREELWRAEGFRDHDRDDEDGERPEQAAPLEKEGEREAPGPPERKDTVAPEGGRGKAPERDSVRDAGKRHGTRGPRQHVAQREETSQPRTPSAGRGGLTQSAGR
jgi:hypothetical protein